MATQEQTTSGAAEAERPLESLSDAEFAQFLIGLRREIEAFGKDKLVKVIKDNIASSNEIQLKEEQENHPIPEKLLCPISNKLMKDPVCISTGKTYDRSSLVERWSNTGIRMCPKTNQLVGNPILYPNDLVLSFISEWCVQHGQGMEQNQYDDILQKLSSSSIPQQAEAIRELRDLTEGSQFFGAFLLKNLDMIPKLLSTIISTFPNNCVQEVQNDFATIIINISIDKSSKKIIGNTPQAISSLVTMLKTGELGVCRKLVSALLSLSEVDSNKVKIGELGAIKSLLELLQRGGPTDIEAIASTILSLCMAPENIAMAVTEGVVGLFLKTIEKRWALDECLSVLSLLKNSQQALEEMCWHSPCFRQIRIEASSSLTSRSKASDILLAISKYDQEILVVGMAKN